MTDRQKRRNETTEMLREFADKLESGERTGVMLFICSDSGATVVGEAFSDTANRCLKTIHPKMEEAMMELVEVFND